MTPFIIAITGGSGSGKSTIAAALKDRCAAAGVTIFNEDGYYWPISHYGDVADAAARQTVINQVNYDDPASKDTALMARQLSALKSGHPIEQPIYNYDLHDRVPDRTLRIEPTNILVVEGIHVLSIPELRPLVDLSVYVDTPDDLRLARRMRRDVLERGRSVDSVLRQYLGSVRASHYRHTYPVMFEADLVIADEGLPAYGQIQASDEAINRMLAPILARLDQEGRLRV